MLSMGSIFDKETPHQHSRQGFSRTERTVGTDFDAAVTPDTSVVIKGNTFSIRCDGLCRTKLQAVATGPANKIINNRTLDQMLSYQSLKLFWADGQGPQQWKCEIVYLITISDDINGIFYQPQSFTGSMGGESVRIQP